MDNQSQTSSATVVTQYYPTPLWKFLILSLSTFGLYETYWIYKNWKYIRERDGSNILPLARALFSPIWFYSLAKDIIASSRKQSTVWAIPLAIAYFIVGITWRLPGPYYLIALFNIVLTIPLVLDVNDINIRSGAATSSKARFRIKHTAVAIIGLPLLCLAVSSEFQITPASQVIPGEALPSRVPAFLRESGILVSGERIEFFYSGGFFAYANDGNYITDKRVVSYFKDEGVFYSDHAVYREIEDIDVTYSDNFMDDTRITIHKSDGTDFLLLISSIENQDRAFVNRMLDNWQRLRGWQ